MQPKTKIHWPKCLSMSQIFHYLRWFSIVWLCLLGLGYQSCRSILAFLEYPYDVVMFDRRASEEILFPSITLCPDNWFDSGKEICKENPHFCTAEGQMMTIGYYHFQNNGTIRKLVRFDSRNIFRCKMISSLCPEFDCIDYIKATYFRQPRSQCYTLDLAQFLPKRHSFHKCKATWSYRLELSSEWNSRVVSLANEWLDVGIFVQGPGIAMPAKQAAVELPIGKDLHIGVRQSVTERLKKPFSSNCKDYKGMDDEFFGLNNREYCIQECIIAIEMQMCNCVLNLHEYAETIARNLPICHVILGARCFRTISGTDAMQDCVKQCQVNCLDVSYDLKLFSIRDLPNENNETMPVKKYNIKMEFYSDKIQMSKEQPMTSMIELLGLLGGYGGMWIGISLLDTVNSARKRILRSLNKGNDIP